MVETTEVMLILLYSWNQVILYKLSGEVVESGEVMKKWVYVGYVRAHTHDVRALTIAVPISREGSSFIFVLLLGLLENFLKYTFHHWLMGHFLFITFLW